MKTNLVRKYFESTFICDIWAAEPFCYNQHTVVLYTSCVGP